MLNAADIMLKKTTTAKVFAADVACANLTASKTKKTTTKTTT